MARPPLNPIIPGFAPDPSICLIGDTYFLVNSTFHLFPGLPIYASEDLVNWRHIGNAINRPEQLTLRRATTRLIPWEDGSTMVATGGLYAPTIRHHKGTTYVICTNVLYDSPSHEDGERTENFFVSTTDIWSDKWSDPVYYDFHGIDPSLLFDGNEDGRAYIQGTQFPEFHIYNMEVDLQTGAMVTAPKCIWTGDDKRYTEGPHLYKRDGWYYLLCAEGGTFPYHMVAMARSRSIWGPFEKYEGNPVWTAHGTDNYVQHTGHADLLQDKNGEWWIVMLGVRMRGGRYIMGRESFLSSVEWPADGWPKVEPVMPEIHGRSLPARTTEAPIGSVVDGVDWLYIRDPVLGNYKIEGTAVELTPTPADLSSSTGPVAFVGNRQRVLQGEASAVLDGVGPGHSVSRAGLAVFKDELRHISIGYDFGAKQVFLKALNPAKRLDVTKQHDVALGGKLNLRITYTEDEYKFWFKEDSAKEWTSVETIDTEAMSGFDFTGPIIGVFAVGEGDSKARFEDIRVQ